MARSFLPEKIDAYVNSLATSETKAQKALRIETQKLPFAGMQIAPDQGAFLTLLVRSIGARNAIEIGTFTGYSALAIARALPEDGKLICCDVSEEWTSIARRYWKDSGLENRIELKLAPALETLEGLIGSGKQGTFDFAFIDADKASYDAYYEACLKLLRPNGLIAIDNVLWSGAVTDPAATDADTVALRALNIKIANDTRVDAAMLTIGDGVTLVRKK